MASNRAYLLPMLEEEALPKPPASQQQRRSRCRHRGRQDKDFAAPGESWVCHLGGHGIHQTFLNLDVGVLGLADVVDSLQEVAVGQLDDVGLGDGGHIVLAVLAGVLEGSAAMRSLPCLVWTLKSIARSSLT